MANKIKIGLLGDMGVGKTCIVQRFCFHKYRDLYESTIGIEMSDQEVVVDNQSYPIQIWDTAGQERFRSVSRVFFNDIKGIFIVFSLDNMESLNHCKDWLDDFYSLVDQSKNIPVVLVGNKLDLITDENNVRVPEDIIKKFVSNNDIPLYIETSSKKDINIDSAFQEMVSIIIKRNLHISEKKNEIVEITQEQENSPRSNQQTTNDCSC
ncbi:small GTPase RabH, putative [Entamoeba histolytica HM-3:IMSS]|uniref:Rab family GTPase n=5 Tax=Entamoeba histolytica TaxID=5759 RepID=A0A8U0WPV5_ENTH1|nr:Rab family GTPase [Entamoeba histolytica HM-1:IMSS]EAL51688.1 Rab family GTPase [Entamoeba histolytica HM-1:IMSS]EMS13333.1 small GTPase RabH, putative [Entamoeba histolytica HM-3:IMSS]BAB40677.1 small GTPase RabH [Entamoeba histolytica]GAT99114.1 Rab family GTPase [Entamoeba histolytica]|eukprot:XP_657074.1 Rab family GTPase [Entamoeba histolytica HM-1:IMSS]